MSDAPVAGEAPDLSAGTEILRELLTIERERLKVAREIEQRREMVFPETSVIVRDIESREKPQPPSVPEGKRDEARDKVGRMRRVQGAH